METEDRYRTARGLRSKIITQRNTKYRESENSLPGDSLCCCLSCSSLIQISIITGIFIIVFLPAIIRIIISAEHEMPTVSESVVISSPIHNGAFWRDSFWWKFEINFWLGHLFMSMIACCGSMPGCNVLLKVSKSRKKYAVLDSSKKRTLGKFSVYKIDPAFIFWKNPGWHNLLLRFTDL